MALERITELCDKLYHPKNVLCRMYMAKWYEDSRGWAEAIVANEPKEVLGVLRMKYILNHMCPSLVHLLPKPANKHNVYNYKDATRYEFENTQMRVVDCNEEVISHGIDKTVDEWEYLLCAISPLVCASRNISHDAFFVSEGISVPLSSKANAVVSKYSGLFEELIKSEN